MTQSYRPDTIHSSAANQQQQAQPQMYNSNQLAGFETASPVTGFPGGAAGAQNRASASAFPAPVSQTAPTTAPPTGVADSTMTQPAEYPYRAKAIYSYEANPDDANEISFTKHEILEALDGSSAEGQGVGEALHSRREGLLRSKAFLWGFVD
ncbi:Transmembrane osmosensor [Oleoguttula sp. CCFEE 5521]